MGMFAYVRFEAPCPLCGLVLTEWQTKDPEVLELQTVSIGDVQNWYTHCDGIIYKHEDKNPPADANWIRSSGVGFFRRTGCGAWLEYNLTVEPKR